jgi:hypothetical protein
MQRRVTKKEAGGIMLYVLLAVFFLSLLISIGASAAFTRRLEMISDRFRFSPGLLILLGALGANIPNYIASLSAAVSGQVGIGIGIIVAERPPLWYADPITRRRRITKSALKRSNHHATHSFSPTCQWHHLPTSQQ